MQARRGKVEQVEQPESFEFSKESAAAAERQIAKYPEGRQQSALMSLLDIAQRQHDGWLPRAAMDYIADYLGMPPMRVYEVASFYTMYNLKPIGKHHVQLCTTTPCWLRGSEKVVDAAKKHLGIGLNETTDDGEFTLSEVECLGACVNAPMCQVGDVYYEDLDEENIVDVLKTLASGKQPKPGSQTGRQSSEPVTGPTTLEAFTKAAPAAKAPAKKAASAKAEKAPAKRKLATTKRATTKKGAK